MYCEIFNFSNYLYIMDIIALSALIISILTVCGGVLLKLHLSHCKSGCCESDCTRNRKNSVIVEDEEEPKLQIESQI